MNINKNIMYGSTAVIIVALALAFAALSLTGCPDVSNLIKPDLTGSITLTNYSPKVGEKIDATYHPGNGSGAETWQWYRVSGTDLPIADANSGSYTVTAEDVGSYIKVKVSFSDQNDSVSAVTTSAVAAAAPHNADITYTVEQTGGADGTADSTGIVFTFNASVDSLNLTAANITVGERAAKAADAVLTGEGTSRTLSPITVSKAGKATVTITKPGIVADTKHIDVYKDGEFVPVLTGITAVYTQGSAIIYPTTPLDDLKANLTVKAQYGVNSEETLSAGEYTLSGTLAVGTSTVTVTYTDSDSVTKTTTFNVTVAAPECDCAVKVHPYGEPCDCEAEGTPACTCTEEPPECDCAVKVHPLGEPCDCPLAGTESCDCTEEGEPLKFTVIFDPNDGVTAHTTHLVTEGGTATKPENPTRENYEFVYWFDSETGDEWDFDTVITAEITLKAKWAYQSFMEMVLVGSGSFEMGQETNGSGSFNIQDIHTVTLTGFSIGKYEVTQKEWETVMGSLPSGLTAASGGKGDNYPIRFVSWYDALVFCNKLSMLEGFTPAYSIDGKTDPAEWGTVPTTNSTTWNAVTVVVNSNGYRLPTEAQWEYAAKGGPSATVPYFIYPGSNTVGDVAVYGLGQSGYPVTVGTKTANQLGLFDMSGNVAEWVWDWHSDSGYSNQAVTDPTGLPSGSNRVLRGGSYTIATAAIQLRNLRSIARQGISPNDNTYAYFGFRIARPTE